MCLLLKVAAQQHVIDSGQRREAGNLIKHGVVDNSQVASNGLEQRERNVAELGIVDEGDGTTVLGSADAGKVGSLERDEVGVGVKLEARLDLGEGGSIERLDVGDLDLEGRLKLGKVHLHIVSVLDKNQSLCNVDKVGVEHGELLVVVDGHGVDSCEVETTNVAEEGVGNVDRGSIGDARGAELEGLKLGQAVEGELADAAQAGHVDAAEKSGILDQELAVNLLEGRARDGEELRGAVDDEVTLERLGAVNVKSALKSGRDSDLATDGGAAKVVVDGVDDDVVGALVRGGSLRFG